MASPRTRVLEERFEFLKQQIIGQKKTDMKDENVLKRILYADCELLRMDIEIEKEFLNSDTGTQMDSELKSYCELLNIGTVKRKGHWLDVFDEILRLISVCFCLISFAVFFAVPSIFLYPVDKILLRYGLVDRSYQSTVLIKRLIGKFIILLSGIDVHVQGLDENTFAKSKNLAFYSHGSTLDPFIIAATCPVRHLSIAKSDLFLVPYFAWLMYALGAIAIDRSNRDTAVLALKKAASTMTEDDCVTVAPEGKRSTTGQLLEFKKGPFHLWEELKIPVIPIVIFGAFDLYPPKRQMCMPGKVYIRYLTPIQPSEASTRDEMSGIVRRRMLDAWRECPSDICRQLNFMQRLKYFATIFCLFLSHYFAYKYYLYGLLFETWGFSVSFCVQAFITFSVFVTLGIYVYAVYLVYWVQKLFTTSSTSAKK